MTTSTYMPDVQVEVAFNAGYATPAASRTWTDVSQYVELRDLIGIGVGRGDEFSIADANKVTLTVDNTDGRFSPGNASGAYSPNVKIGRPLRITVTPPGGSPQVRFLGFVDEWPVEWDGGEANAKAKVVASSRLARMGLSAALSSAFVATAQAASPLALWRMNDSAAPGVEVSGQESMDVDFSTVTWQTATGPDGPLTAPTITVVDSEAANLSARVFGVGPLVIECFFATSTQDQIILVELEKQSDPSYALRIQVDENSVDAIIQTSTTSAVASSAATVEDGEVHHLAVAVDATSMRLYLDGTLVDTETVDVFALDVSNYVVKVADTNGSPATVSVSYIMLSDDEAGITDRSAVGQSIASPTATASELIELYADLAGVEAAERDVEATTELVAAPNSLGLSPTEVLRKAEATDGGVLFDAPDGTLTYRARTYRYSTAAAFTLDAGAQQVESDLVPRLDRTGLVNAVTVTGADDVSAYVSDADSIAEYGLASRQVETLGDTAMCFAQAGWILAVSKDPSVRVSSLTVDMLTLPGATRDAILAAAVGDVFTVQNLPDQAPSTEMDFFIEGWSETFGPETHRVTFNTTRRDPSLYDVWTVEDATYGAYDSNPIAW